VGGVKEIGETGKEVGGWRSAALEVRGKDKQAGGSWQKTEDRRQRTEGRGQILDCRLGIGESMEHGR